MAARLHKLHRLFKARCPSVAKPVPTPFHQAMAAVEAEDLLVGLLSKPGVCSLCGRSTWQVAMRVVNPPEAQQWGAAIGKTRVIMTHLCCQCCEGDGPDRLDVLMREEMGMQAGASERKG